jgi:NitT/TauT family transport system permease protein
MGEMALLILLDWLRRAIPPVIVGVLILAIWEAACWAWQIPPYLFPSPSAISKSLAEHRWELLLALWSTLKVTLKAFGIAVAIGTLIAFLFVQSRLIEVSFFPYAILLQVTPIVAIAPLIIILIKDTQAALTICAAIIAVFPIISNTTIGLHSVDPELLNFFRMNKANRFKLLVRLQIPSALPFFLAGLRISSGLALIGAVVAEFIAGTGGLGAGLAYEILNAGFRLDIPLMFAALLLIAITGILLFLVMVALSKLLLGRWHESVIQREI